MRTPHFRNWGVCVQLLTARGLGGLPQKLRTWYARNGITNQPRAPCDTLMPGAVCQAWPSRPTKTRQSYISDYAPCSSNDRP